MKVGIKGVYFGKVSAGIFANSSIYDTSMLSTTVPLDLLKTPLFLVLRLPRITFTFENPLLPNGSFTMKLFKGLRSVILSTQDADFMVNHPLAKTFLEWEQTGRSPEETYYASLIRLKVDSETKVLF